MKASADVADSPASFQPLKAQTSAGARRPSGRRSQRSGCIESTVPRPLGAPVLTHATRRGHDRRPARRGRRRRRLRLLAQGPADGALRHAVPGARAARPDAARSRRARSATPTCWPGASSAATSCAWPAASSASATSCRSRCGRSRGPRAPIRRRSCPSPTATSRSSTASSSTSRARSTTPPTAGLLERLLGDDALRAEWRRAPCTRGGHHAYLGGLLEHTVAVGTLALECAQLHPRLNPDLLLTAALVHDLGKTREFTYGAEIGLTDEGRLLGHVVLGQRLLDAHELPDDRRLALAHCVLTHHGPEAAPGRRFGSRRGAGALPPERARRVRQGRAWSTGCHRQLLGCASCAS